MKYFQGIRELGKIIENSKTIEKIKTNWNIDKRIENKQGITLIALVVTIVVLLILAGVTINLLFGNDGIFNIANQSKIEYEIGAIKDRINNVIADWSIERLTKPGVTIDDLWDKMVEADIIDNPEEDIEGPEKEGENDAYQVTTNEGYVVEIIVMPDGSVVIGDVVKGDKLPPKIGEITSTSESNSIHIEVEITRSEGEVSLSYYYKKDGEEESSYKALKEEVTDLTADLTGLEQNVVYNIKVVIKDNNGTSEKKINVTIGELTGVVTQKGETIWNNGTASIELETTKTGVTIQYQINTTEGQWKDYEGAITELKYGDTVFAVVTDGTNQSGYSSIDILDEKEPQQASINLSGTSTNTTESITATVTHTDNESGVDIGNCRWVYNTNSDNIGTETTSYPNTFNSNGETITLSATTVGTYYLHVLTQDKAGNKIETISQGVTVTQLVTGITVSPTSITLEEGQTQQLTASITPDNASNKTVSWSSNNINIATVSSTGLVTAKAAGTATITVKANDGSGVSGTCNVTVTNPTIEKTLKEGNYVYYEDGTGVTRKCVVLYGPENVNYSSYGVQIIVMESVEEVWIGKDADSRDDEYNDERTNFSETYNEFNNAISTLNTKAETYINPLYASDARCVGSVPNNKNSESEVFISMGYAVKNQDDNYLSDYNKMLELGIVGSNYVFASREGYFDSRVMDADMRSIDMYGNLNEFSRQYALLDITSFQDFVRLSSIRKGYGFRPVFTLKSGLKVTGGSGTSNDPYTLGT